MALNETQLEYLEGVRNGEIDRRVVRNDLSEIDRRAYQKASFRELLFAIDATNRVDDVGWTSIFVNGLIDHSGWIDDGTLSYDVFVEIGNLHETYGRGVHGFEVVVDMIEIASQVPPNADSFARRCIREYFNGIQPVSDHALFAIKKYFEKRLPLCEADLKLLFHIEEETKGLCNAHGFTRFFATAAAGGDVSATRVIKFLERSDEHTDPELELIRVLRERDVEVPSALLACLNLGKEKLLGLA